MWRSLAEMLPGCALFVLALYCVLQIRHLLPGSGPAPLALYGLVALGAGALAVAAAAIVAARRHPSIGAMARTADRTFALHECVATALEVAAKEPGRFGVIGEALVQSAAAHADRIDVRRLVPLRLPRTALAVPALLLVAALLTAVPPPVLHEALAALRPASGPQSVQHAAERAEDVATVAALAAIVRRDGRERADPQLHAVAQELGALAQRFAETPAMDRAGLADGMERLLAAANDAYARAGESPPVALSHPRALDSARRGAAMPRAAGSGQAATAGAAQDAAAAPRPPGQRNGPGGAAPLLPAPERTIAGARPPGGALDALTDAALAAATVDAEQDYRDLGGEPAEEGGAGQVFGGAGGGAPGDYAGFGTRALTGAPTARLGLTATGDLLLDNPLGEGGRRTRLNLAGQPAEAVVTGAPAAGTAWRAAAEHEVTRTALPVTARDLVGRYFQAMTAERGQ